MDVILYFFMRQTCTYKFYCSFFLFHIRIGTQMMRSLHVIMEIKTLLKCRQLLSVMVFFQG